MITPTSNANDLLETAEKGLLDLDLLRDECRSNLYFFAKGILGWDWLVPHVHLGPSLILQDRSITRKTFVLPRGWLKTTLCSISYPIWRAVHDPEIRCLIAQNNHTNAKAKLKVISGQFRSNELLRALYPNVLPTRDCTWSSESLQLNRSETFPEGTFDCIGVKGQPTSRHYNLIVEDDTVAPDFDELGQEMLAPTHEDVQKAIAWHRLCTPLLTNPKDDEIMVVGTRWYEHDLISHIQEKETHYKVIERSCRENAQGESDPRGEVTYPERFDAQTLHEIEQSLGPYFYSTLMLNRPISVGNMVFKPEWIRYYEQLPPRRSLHVYTTVDCATDPELSTTRPDKLDYSTVLTAGKDVLSGDIYVLEYFRARCSPGEHTAAIFDHVQRWNPIKVGYEDIAYQKSLDYWLKDLMRQHQKFFILEAVKRQGRKSKETHIMGLQPIFASGSILIRRHHKELESELLTFPRGQHDDLLDTLAMQTPMWAMTRKAQSKNHPNLQYLNTIEAAIESIRNRQRYANHQDSIIHDPFRCSSSWN